MEVFEEERYGDFVENRLLPEELYSGESQPLWLNLEVTTSCNVACIMCYKAKLQQRGYKLPRRRLDVDELEHHLAGIENLRGVTLSQGHGETLLHRDVVRIVSLLKGKGAFVEILSNGMPLTHELARQLIDARLDRLSVSLHGATRETAEAIMRKSDFGRITSQLRELRRLKAEFGVPVPELILLFVGMRRNICELSDMIVLAKDLGATGVAVKSLLTYPDEEMQGLAAESLVRHATLLRREFMKAREVANKSGVRLEVNAPYSSLISGKAGPDCVETKAESAQMQVGENSRPARETVACVCAETSATKTEKPTSSARRTRYCLFPFEKPIVNTDFIVTLCCSERGRMVVMNDGRERNLHRVFSGSRYRSVRMALLTGEALPPYCASCERAPEVEPFVLQMDVALRQASMRYNDAAWQFVLRTIDRYPEYVAALSRIGATPQPSRLHPSKERRVDDPQAVLMEIALGNLNPATIPAARSLYARDPEKAWSLIKQHRQGPLRYLREHRYLYPHYRRFLRRVSLLPRWYPLHLEEAPWQLILSARYQLAATRGVVLRSSGAADDELTDRLFVADHFKEQLLFLLKHRLSKIPMLRMMAKSGRCVARYFVGSFRQTKEVVRRQLLLLYSSRRIW